MYFCDMIQLDKKIISLDIFKKYFSCDLKSCKGACCIEGDSGAPLEKNEKIIIEENYQDIRPYMQKKGIDTIDKQGVGVIDKEGDLTTPLIDNQECAFVTIEGGVAKCAIEKAFSDKRINFRKPLSCHLFPIRITSYKNFDAINYEKISICDPACNLGESLKIPLYVFLKEALIRKYGNKCYDELIEVANKLDI